MILDADATTFRPPNGSSNDRALAQIARSSSASVGKLGPNVSTFEMRAQTSSSPNATIRGGNDRSARRSRRAPFGPRIPEAASTVTDPTPPASRRTAARARFLLLIQSGERPER